MNLFNRDPFLQGISKSPGKSSAWGFLALLLLSLTLVAGFAVSLGGTVTTDVTPSHIHVEVEGKSS